MAPGPVRRDEAAGLRREFDETQRRDPAQHRDGEDADAPSGDLRDGTGHHPAQEAADGGSGDEGACRPCGVRGIDLLGEICDRDRRYPADDQPLEEPSGEQKLKVGANGTSRPTTVATVTETEIALHPADAVGKGGPGMTPMARPTVDAETISAASAAPMCRSAEISGRTACGE